MKKEDSIKENNRGPVLYQMVEKSFLTEMLRWDWKEGKDLPRQ